ncbi:uncharacterized protein AB675_8191 [Cyphellophora attinorum]|uniref:Uncharacterized protein n=1 Tax=Cyphellophora attinorum TaxID=1664694 RepID=A0A0N1HBW2_9EURO|nr:uncharacterized protein AB675_8191 [Phialophora attinorum]KPI41004.1 hypothetical protein AB675_8191 [Phialophora attinorum]
MRFRRVSIRQVLLLLVPLVSFTFFALRVTTFGSYVVQTTARRFAQPRDQVPLNTSSPLDLALSESEEAPADEPEGEEETAEDAKSRWKEKVPDKPRLYDYRELFSRTTRDRKYFPIHFGSETAYNPNIIPHPTKHEMWIVVAQHEQTYEDIESSQQLTCTAGFLNGVLLCADEPTVLPIAKSVTGHCDGDLAYINFRHGPRDARMFMGPTAPYIVYGSQSGHTCLGLWLQDTRMLLEEFKLERHVLVEFFKQATEIQRPLPWKAIEKNFFIFWDADGKAYAHYDLWPLRSFAQIDADGSVAGADLAPAAEANDLICMARYMPEVASKLESIHQATNSISITLCRRKDPGCTATDDNTFIMHIFHHKTYYDFHGVYEPYIMLFRRRAPFELYAISTRPFWIHGRAALTSQSGSMQFKDREEWIPEGHTEFFYIVSMSWMSHGQKYHGYLDDKMMLSFGIEDTRSGAMDVLAADLVQDLGLC